VLQGKVKEEAGAVVREQSGQMGREVVELNVQADHVHLVVLIPPKLSVATYMGRVKGKSALRLFSVFRDLRPRPYWGKHFWSQGYCVGAVGLGEEKIRKYVKYQERQERREEELRFSQ
jgi:putative transposase